MRNSLLTVLLLCCIGAALLGVGACAPGRDYENEARIAANAQVSAAQIAANAQVQTTQISETEATKRNTAVVSVLPFLLGIIAVAGVVWLVVWFRGRRELIIVEAMMMIPEAVQSEATRRGLLVEQRADGYYLVDEQRRPRAKMLEVDGR